MGGGNRSPVSRLVHLVNCLGHRSTKVSVLHLPWGLCASLSWPRHNFQMLHLVSQAFMKISWTDLRQFYVGLRSQRGWPWTQYPTPNKALCVGDKFMGPSWADPAASMRSLPFNMKVYMCLCTPHDAVFIIISIGEIHYWFFGTCALLGWNQGLNWMLSGL